MTAYSVCSDILTPLPALGVPFEIDDIKGPLIANPVRTLDQVHVQRPFYCLLQYLV